MNAIPRADTPRLDGKVALVTGSATGIGRETVLAFAREGANTVVNYSRSKAEARQTQRDVEGLGVRTLLCRADVADETAVLDMVGQTVEAFGRLDILVNNAGTTKFVPFSQLDDLTDEIWDR
ncbi:MAG: 3-ketoacyl-ACP reductase, partial [Dehalococcoidia bacterium]|nr:3-ketoacyl-ACP reductase [Dehalococcoidia bacterium]